MKQLTLVIILFFTISAIGNAQKSKKTMNSNCILEIGKPKPLYVGCENRVMIGVSGYKTSQLTIKVDGEKIEKSDADFIFIPKRIGPVEVEIHAGGRYIAKYALEAKMFPKPMVTIGRDKKNWRGGIMTRSQLTGLGKLQCTNAHYTDDFEFNLISFQMSYEVDGITETLKSNSNKMTKDQKDAILNDVKKNRRVIFDNIKARGPGGEILILSALVYKIR